MNEFDLQYNIDANVVLQLCSNKKICRIVGNNLMGNMEHMENMGSYIKYFTCVCGNDYFVLIQQYEDDENKTVAESEEISNPRYYYLAISKYGFVSYIFQSEVKEVKTFYDAERGNIVYLVTENYYYVMVPSRDNKIMKQVGLSEQEQIKSNLGPIYRGGKSGIFNIGKD